MIRRTGSRVSIPELRLQEKTAGIVEAAGIGDGAFIMTTERVFKGAALFREGESGTGQEKKGAYG